MPGLQMGQNESGVFVEDIDDPAKEFQDKMVSTLPRVAVTAAVHPFVFSKVLMQLGHEPLPLTSGKAMIVIGRPTLFLPNSIEYVRHIARTSGVSSLYAGVGATIFQQLAGSAASIACGIYLDRKHPNFGGGQAWADDVEERHLSDSVSFNRMTRSIAREGACKIVGTLLARPLQVVMIRQIAQYVGGETKYGGIIDTLRTIIAEEGYAGLYSGVYPQLVAELGILVCTHAGIYLLQRTYVHYGLPYAEADDTEADDKSALAAVPVPRMIETLVPLFVNSMFYPYQCVSTCMAVNTSGLQAGRPLFATWKDCYNHLVSLKASKRGNGMFLRRYQGPITYKGTDAYATNKHSFFA